jgi:hypothetical protein
MPGFNQTGPMGQGSMTGRRMGRCTNLGANLKNQTAEIKENLNENLPENIQGRGFGSGRGRGGRCFGMGQQNRFRGGINK